MPNMNVIQRTKIMIIENRDYIDGEFCERRRSNPTPGRLFYTSIDESYFN